MNTLASVKCPVCGSPAPLVAGGAVTRLYRCPKCTNQLMLPADVGAAPAVDAASPPPAAPAAKGGFMSSLLGKLKGQA